jgi:hypothetical protein
MTMTKHDTQLHYNAGLRTYKVWCEDCGQLRGISLTRRDAESKAARHRREQRAASTTPRCTCTWADDEGDPEVGPSPYIVRHDPKCPQHSREAGRLESVDGVWLVEWDHTDAGLLTYSVEDRDEGRRYIAHYDGGWRARPEHLNSVDHEILIPTDDPEFHSLLDVLNRASGRGTPGILELSDHPKEEA